MIREPKYGHLKELHKAIKLCETSLVSLDPTVTSLGGSQEVIPHMILSFTPLVLDKQQTSVLT